MADILRVATYNLHSCVGGDRRYDPERTLRVLQELDADVLALQEVGGYLHDGIEQIHFFEQKLGMHATAGPNLTRRGTQFGNALLVRGRILESRLINLGVLPFEPRGAIEATVETEHGRLRVFATHLGLFPRERRQQIEILARELERDPQPTTVFMGDFNIFGPERTVLKRIGAPRRLPKLYSFPARLPLMSLDRIWTIPNDRLLTRAVHRSALSRIASDHLPVVADIVPAPASHSASLHRHAVQQDL
ncbi:MAG: endonuclease/exonuclease/phosphatase family protein [Gemmatimonas sp.]